MKGREESELTDPLYLLLVIDLKYRMLYTLSLPMNEVPDEIFNEISTKYFEKDISYSSLINHVPSRPNPFRTQR